MGAGTELGLATTSMPAIPIQVLFGYTLEHVRQRLAARRA